MAKIPKEAPLDKVCLLGCGEWLRSESRLVLEMELNRWAAAVRQLNQWC